MERLGIFLLLATLLVSFACGDSDDGANGDAEPTAELSGTAKEFYDLLYGGLDATYRVTYQTTTPEGTPGGGYVVYSQPPKSRVDTSPEGSLEADSVLIDEGDRTIGCSGGPQSWACSEIDPLDDSVVTTAGPVAFLSANDVATYTVTKSADGRAIAGQEATCYQLTPASNDDPAPSEYCLTTDGVVLFANTPSQTVEATEFSTAVEEAAFTAPAEPS